LLKGLCALPILKVDGAVDHRDVFFSAPEKAENTKLCTPPVEGLEAPSPLTPPTDERRDRVSLAVRCPGKIMARRGMESIHALLVLAPRVTKGRGSPALSKR
jgi:hypothetical protein